MILEIKDSGITTCKCECGAEFIYEYPILHDDFLEQILKSKAEKAICEDCRKRKEEEERQKTEAERRKYLSETIAHRLTEAEFDFVDLEKPPVRSTACWLWEHRWQNVVLAGETGTGKSTSATVVMRNIFAERDTVARYTTWRNLAAEYLEAKTSTNGNELRFWRKIKLLDILVVDEIVGKKGTGKMNGTGQELFFELLDGVYAKRRKTKLWVLGNFYAGALDDMLTDPEPFRRRIREAFVVGWATGNAVEAVTV